MWSFDAMFEYCCCSHVFEEEFAFIGEHALGFAVEKFAIKLRSVAEDD